MDCRIGSAHQSLPPRRRENSAGIDQLSIAWVADQPLASAIDGHIDEPVVEQRAIELGEEDAGVLHLHEILHRDGGGEAKPDQPRRQPRERRAPLGGRPGAEARVEDNQLQVGCQP